MRKVIVIVWSGVLCCALAYMAWSRAAGSGPVSFDEISVHRLNVVETDGKPRVVISDRDHFPGAYWGGKEYRHPSRELNTSFNGGFLFFNDNGDEVGGFGFRSQQQGEHHYSGTSLLFDQYQSQEIMGLAYDEEDGKRAVGLKVWDEPDESIFPYIEAGDKAMRAATPAERDALLKKMRDGAKGKPFMKERMFAGKELDAVLVKLADKEGRPRLLLKVTDGGEASIELLDAAGKVTSRVPAH